MLIEDELKEIYLNYKNRKIIPFPIRRTQKKNIPVILKKFLNKDWEITTFLLPQYQQTL